MPRTHALRPFGRLRAGCGLDSSAASRLRFTSFSCQRANADLTATFILSRGVKKNTSRRSPHTKPGGRPTIFRKAAWMVVAVGTTIAGRPPHRSVQARLRIRLLPWMGSGEACIRVGMQNARLRNPPRQQRGETIPPHLCPLTATYENAPPQPANASAEDAQLSRVTRNRMVLVVAQHNLAKPCTDLGRTMMLAALKLGLNGFELRDHSRLRRNPPDDESFVADALPT